jgi:predicted ATPase/signal transduction histidine kinase
VHRWTRTAMQGYQILETIYQSDRVIVRRAIRDSDGKNVILKSLNGDFPSIRDITRFKYEFELSERALGTGIVPVLELLREGNGLVLVMEDVGGIPLLDYWNSTPKTLGVFLNLSIQISQILGNLHERGIVHKDIKPANLLVQGETGKVYIIDLGLASLLQSEEQAPVQPETLEGTLSYISPEQTGRMNRSIDLRSDLYSLGITLYELVTGRLPFTGTDPLELVHAHIAVSPTPPIEVREDIPNPISDLILKLLSKNAEDRYLSARGLQEDLELSRELLLNEKPIAFVPGERESRGIFSIPQKLYGREAEVSFLLDAFERIASPKDKIPEEGDTEGYGGTKLVLVGGYSGVGKTALISEIHKPILEKRGTFLSGKFDQFKRNIPYYSLIQAFTGLVRQILTEKEEKIQRWKTRILDSCRPNVVLLTDLIPELVHITGQQPAVNELSPQEAENRFQKTLQDFVGVFASPEHPLVLFLDDLQWADLPTFKFLESIVLKNEVHHLFLIGAYRDNEVDALHPFTLMVQTLEKENIRILKIALAPLMEFFIERMIRDTLHREVGSELPELVYQKTGGNPFFVRQLLTTLYRDKHLYYSSEKRWEYNLEAILQTGYSENVVDVVAKRLKELSAETQEVLKVASCIGDRFELSLLANVLQKSQRETAKQLQEASREGTILPLDVSYKVAETLESEMNSEIQLAGYKFIHDRIQQAANTLLSEEERVSNHVKIGKALLGGIDSESLQEKIFEIVNHLNYGIPTLESVEEKTQLLDLNYKAGKSAVESFSFESSVKYFENAISLIQDSTPKEIRFQCKFECYNSMYKSGKVSIVIEKLDEVFQECSTKLEKAQVYNLKVICQTNLGEYENSVRTCIEALKLFDIDLKENITGKDVFSYYKSLAKKIGNKTIKDLYNLLPMENQEIKIVMNILMNTATAAYWKFPNFSSIFSLIMINLSLDFGNSIQSSYGYTIFGIFLITINEIQYGCEFGDLAKKLTNQYKDPSLTIKVNNNLGVFINNWSHHIGNSITLLEDSFNKFFVFRDVVNLASIVASMIQYSFIQGKNINNIDNNYSKYLKYLQDFNSNDFYFASNNIFSLIKVLRGEKTIWTNFNNEEISYEEYLNLIQSNELKTGLFSFLNNSVYIDIIFHNFDFSNIEKIKKLRTYSIGTITFAHEIYVTSLLLLKLNLKDPENPEVDFTKELESNLKQYKKWAEINPANFKHKYNLILAEYARFKKEFWDASLYYDIALESASENEYNLDAGLIAELAGEFYLEQNRIQQAKKYFQTSLYYYNLCGAMAKVGHVKSRYPEYTPSEIGSTEKSSLSNTTKGTQTAYTSQTNLDIQTILKANRAISEEINLESLLKKLLSIVLENAGATRGILLLYDGDTLCVEAEGKKETGNIQIYSHFPIKSYTEIPDSIVQYVSKTSESILLDSALEDTQFGNNFYLQREKIQSLLCMPISSKGKNIGFLYLENSLIRAAFTKSRIDILNMIVSQGAVSIENAKLYQNMEKNVNSRTKELESQKKSIEELNIFIKNLNDSSNLILLLEKISLYINNNYGGYKVAIGLVDSSGKVVNFTKFDENKPGEIDEEIHSIKIPIVNVAGAHAFSFLTNKPLFTKTLSKSRITPEEILIIEKFQFKSFLILPLILNEKNIGFLDIGSPDSSNILNKAQINELSILAEQLSGIIYRINLNSELLSQKAQLEKSLIQSDRMVTLGTMVAGVAHEVNTPLGAIKANSENISEQMKSLLEFLNPEKQGISHSELEKVIKILELSGSVSTTFSSKEQRALRKKLTSELETKGVKHPEEVAEKMMDLGLVSAFESENEIFHISDLDKLLGIASLFFGIQKKSGVIQTSAERVSKIVKSLKSYMHFDQSEEKKMADLTEGMETVLTILHSKIKHGIEVTKNYGDVPQILCFPDELNQIWTNLIHNAVQAMNEKGSLQIDIEKVSSLYGAPDIDKSNPNYTREYISVSIQDSGSGISPEIRQKIFQAFFTTKPAGEGSGLGLHIIGKILEKHEGALYLESEPGRTRFSVLLPLGD